MKRLKELFENLVYAGMKPGHRTVRPSEQPRLPGAIERFLNGPSGADPLYISNRTTAQKIRRAILIAALPLLILVLAVSSVLYFGHKEKPKQAQQPTAAETVAKLMPDLSSVNVSSNHEIDVMDVSVQHARLTGTFRNNTDRPLTHIEVVFDLTNLKGSRVGAVACNVASIAPKGRGKCELSIPQKDATYAIVREIRNQ